MVPYICQMPLTHAGVSPHRCLTSLLHHLLTRRQFHILPPGTQAQEELYHLNTNTLRTRVQHGKGQFRSKLGKRLASLLRMGDHQSRFLLARHPPNLPEMFPMKEGSFLCFGNIFFHSAVYFQGRLPSQRSKRFLGGWSESALGRSESSSDWGSASDGP